MKKSLTLIIALLFLLSSCTSVATQTEQSSEISIGDDNVSINKDSSDVYKSDEKRTAYYNYMEEHFNFEYLIDYDLDRIQSESIKSYDEIERFIYTLQVDISSRTFIIDNRYNLIFIDQSIILDNMHLSDQIYELVQEDIEKLATVLEKISFHEWRNDDYNEKSITAKAPDEIPEDGDGYWGVFVEYKDGTVESYVGGGYGIVKRVYPRGYEILRKYIFEQMKTMPEERENIREEELAKIPEYQN